MPSKSPKVLLAWLNQPIGGMGVIQQGFFDSIFGFLTYDTNPETGRQLFGGYTFAATGYIPDGRCKLVEQFLDKSDAEWLLMLDWDITFSPDDVYALVETASPNTVVSGCYVTYFGEGNALRPCWFAEQGGEEYVPVSSFVMGKQIELTVCGMGFTIMHRTLLKKMRKAYKDDPWPWFGNDIINGSRVGEDITFCSRARKQGATIIGHGGVMLGHTKAKTLRPEDMLNPALYNNVYNVPSSKVRARPTKPNRKTVLSVGAGGDRTVPKEFAGWDLHTLDIDASSSPDIVADGRDLSVIPDNTYDAIYCSHNIEHYPRHDVTKVLLGFNRVLKPGGVVDIHTPDLGATMERFVKEKLDIDSTLYESPGGPITVKDVIYGYGKQIERSGNDFYAHKGGFTQKSLKRALFRAGFTNIDIATVDLELRAIGHKATAKLAKPKLSKKKQLATKA